MAMPDKLTVPETDLPGRPLLPEHIKYLEEGGISAAYLAKTPLIRSTEIELDLPVYFQGHPGIVDPKGILFGWPNADGEVEWQFRPDNPMTDPETGERKKYLFKVGSEVRYGVILKRGGNTVWIVEGTKQGHSVASVAPAGVTVIQIPGCAGWSRNGWNAPTGLVKLTAQKTVYIVFDADAGRNLNVYRAGEELAKKVKPLAKAVRFPQCPGEGTGGIDDFLAGYEPVQRWEILETLAKNSLTRPAAERPKPKLTSLPGGKKDGDGDGEYTAEDDEWMFTPAGKLRVDAVAKHYLSLEYPTPVAMAASGPAVYNPDTGTYDAKPEALEALVGRTLRDQYDTGKLRNIESRLRGLCYERDLLLPDARLGTDGGDSPVRKDGLICVGTGVIDTLGDVRKVLPHDPKYLFSYRFPVAYDPDATCPTFDAWLKEATTIYGTDQSEIVLDALSQLLDLMSLPRKIIFLVGPTRSGKGTLLELARQLVGFAACSGVPLHDLESDQFAVGDTYGKRLNNDGDVKDQYIPSPSNLKKAVGGRDILQGNIKYGKRFPFINQAVWLCAANQLPTVGERSRAFIARCVVVSFPHSHEGSEKDDLPARLAAELPGIFNRVLAALIARRARGGTLLPSHPRVMEEFERKVSLAHAFVDEACWKWEQGGEGWTGPKTIKRGYGMKISDIYTLYKHWAGETGRHGALLQNNLRDQLLTVPGVVRASDQDRHPNFFNLTPNLHPEWGDVRLGMVPLNAPRKPPVGYDDSTTALDPDPDPAPKPTGRFTPQQGRG